MLLPIVGLTWLGVRGSLDKWRVYRDYAVLERNSAVLQQIGQSVHELQRERGRSAGFLSSKGTQFGTELQNQRMNTDHAVAQLNQLLGDFDAARFGASFQEQLKVSLDEVGKLASKRAAVSSLELTAADSAAYYTQTISRLLNVVVAMSHLSKDAEIGNGISCYVNFLQAKEQAGIERATLTGVFVANAFTPESFRRFGQVEAAQATFLRVFESFASEEQRRFAATKVSGPAVDAVLAMRQTAFAQSAKGGFGIVATTWFDVSTARIDLMKEVENRLGADYAQRADEIKQAAQRDFWMLGSSTALLVVVTLIAAWWLLRGITRELLDIAARLSEGSQEVTSAATQVSSASQTTADGASQQAAALEETSASLEEVASMTQRNSDAAAEAKQLSSDAHDAARKGTQEMGDFKQTMEAISGSAANIAKILKTIDEIAFQTNILALNAAVEAARAGEAGAGFSVVAEETGAKVEESVRNSDSGVKISNRIVQHFEEIVAKAKQVDSLVAEIATASREQSQGIGQLNTAVTQMDQVTQANAAGAEETAAQAEQLNAQATELTAVIGNLLQLVGGRRALDPQGLPGQSVPGLARRLDTKAPPLAPAHA